MLIQSWNNYSFHFEYYRPDLTVKLHILITFVIKATCTNWTVLQTSLCVWFVASRTHVQTDQGWENIESTGIKGIKLKDLSKFCWKSAFASKYELPIYFLSPFLLIITWCVHLTMYLLFQWKITFLIEPNQNYRPMNI